MKRKIIIVISILLLSVALVTAVTCYVKRESKPKVSAISTCAIKTDMRKLWNDHASWTREVIICIVDKAPGKTEAIARLLQNQNEIGASIKPYYGENASKDLTRLLREHIIIAADVVTAAKDYNAPALEKANVKWYKNSAEIATFLAKANPKLDAADIRYMMDYHLKLTTIEAVTRIQKNYIKNVEAYDKVHYEIMEMSDMISQGIIDQFPEKFACDKEEDNGGHDHY